MVPGPNTCNHTWSPSSPVVFAETSAARDFTWKNGGQIVFSHPAVQTRNAASRAVPPPVKRRSDFRPPPSRLQYRPQPSRVQKVSGQIADPNDLGSLDLGSIFGHPSQTSASPEDARTTQPPEAPEPAGVVSSPLAVRSTAQAAEETATAVSAAAFEAAAAEELASLELAASEAAVAEEMAAFQGSAASEAQGTQPSLPLSVRQDPESGPRSPLDEIESLGKMLAALEKRNQELQTANEEARRNLEEMASQESELRSQVDEAKKSLDSETHRVRTGEQRLQRANSKIKTLERDLADEVSPLLHRANARIKALEQDLAFETSPRRRQDKRFEDMENSNARIAEAARQMKAKEERLASRTSYDTFKDYFANGNKALQALAGNQGRLLADLGLLQRQVTHWSRALAAFRSFDPAVVQKHGKQTLKAQVPKIVTHVPLQQTDRREEELMGSWGNHDGIRRQILQHIQTNLSRSQQAAADYDFKLRRIMLAYETWRVRSHALRKTMRLSRFNMDTTKTSPLVTVYERHTAVSAMNIQTPASSLAMVVVNLSKELSFAKASGGVSRLISRKLEALERAKLELRMVKQYGILFSMLENAEWVAIQPITIKAFWTRSAPLAYWHAILTSRTEAVDRELILKGGISKDNPIWQNMRGIYDLRRRMIEVEISTLKLALYKSERNLFSKKEVHELDTAIQQSISAASSRLGDFLKRTNDVYSLNRIHTAQAAQLRRLEGAEGIKNVTRRQRRKALKSQSPAKRPVYPFETATSHSGGQNASKQSKSTPVAKTTASNTEPVQDVADSIDTAKAAPDVSQPPDEMSQSKSAADPQKSDTIGPEPDGTGLNSAVTSEPGAAQSPDDKPSSVSAVQKINWGPASRKDGSRVSAAERRLNATSGASIRPRGRVLPKPHFKQRPSSMLGFRPSSRRAQENTERPVDLVEQHQRFQDERASAPSSEQLNELTAEPAISGSAPEGTGISKDTFEPPLYQIPQKDLRSALMASSTSRASYWTYSLYKSPDGKRPTRHYCRKFDQAETAARLFVKEKVIGFDIEWEMGSSVGNGSIKDNVSLIQIACDDRIALFQIASFYGDSAEALMPPTLKAILESPDIIKAGVNIAGDFTRLRKCLGVEGRGIFELSHLYKLVKYSEDEPIKVNKTPVKLADQVQDLLFLPLAKGHVRTSSWSKELSGEQIDYACSDAYAGFRLFHALDRARKAMSPMPPRPAFWEADMPIRLGNGELADDARKRSKAMARKVARQQSCAASTTTTTPEEEQALDEEEDEAEAEVHDDAEDLTSAVEDRTPEVHLNGQLAASSEFEKAEIWMQQWEDKLLPERKNKTLPTSIRAYALWHQQGLELKQVAEVMRQPPLALSTVASYVLEVVRSENLPSNTERVQQALNLVPTITRWKYRGLLQRKNKAGG